jgi:hypothetical protein
MVSFWRTIIFAGHRARSEMAQCSLDDDSQSISIPESFWHIAAAKLFETLLNDLFSTTTAGKQRSCRQKKLHTMSADERRPVFRICALRLQYVSHGQYPASVSTVLRQIFDTGYQSGTGYS